MARLITDPPASGARNMAIDEVLLDSAVARGSAALRFYSWREATVSLGYFQSVRDQAQHPASAACPWVRRASGGGAIVHDHELTYSLTLPVGCGYLGDPGALYEAVHLAIVDGLGALKITAQLRQRVDRTPRDEAFLCFRRQSVGDVLLGRIKVAGSAQRRRPGALLQHGSLILRQSSVAPEVPGILELANTEPDPTYLIGEIRESLERRLNLRLHEDCLSDDERGQADRLVRSRYGDSQWNCRR